MKKTISSKLRLNKETVRKLRESDLGHVAGGAFTKLTDLCTIVCSEICATNGCPVVTKGNCTQLCW
jgi:hypothetical protein